MNETDNTRNDRRRSSRGRRRRSGGGDRSAQAQGSTGSISPKSPAPPASPAPRSTRNPKQNEKQPRGKEKVARSGDSNRGDRNPKQGQRRTEQGEAVKNPVPASSRERFSAPRIVAPSLPKPLCPRCGSPIEDLPSALNDKESGAPIHFDCVLARIAEGESMAEGEKVVYLGGGRFGVVAFENPGDLKRFRVRKTIQWEEKDKRADWRRLVTDLYSAT